MSRFISLTIDGVDYSIDASKIAYISDVGGSNVGLTFNTDRFYRPLSEGGSISSRWTAQDGANIGPLLQFVGRADSFIATHGAAFAAAGYPFFRITDRMVTSPTSQVVKYCNAGNVVAAWLGSPGVVTCTVNDAPLNDLGGVQDVSYVLQGGETLADFVISISPDVSGGGASAGVQVINSGDGMVAVNNATGPVDIENSGAGDTTVNTTGDAALLNTGGGVVTVNNGDNAAVENSGTGDVTVNNA